MPRKHERRTILDRIGATRFSEQVAVARIWTCGQSIVLEVVGQVVAFEAAPIQPLAVPLEADAIAKLQEAALPNTVV